METPPLLNCTSAALPAGEAAAVTLANWLPSPRKYPDADVMLPVTVRLVRLPTDVMFGCAAVDTVAAYPSMLMDHVPEAPVPVLLGASSAICATTYAVVAICVELVSTAAVGAVGVPVSAGLANGALSSSCVCMADVTPST